LWRTKIKYLSVGWNKLSEKNKGIEFLPHTQISLQRTFIYILMKKANWQKKPFFFLFLFRFFNGNVSCWCDCYKIGLELNIQITILWFASVTKRYVLLTKDECEPPCKDGLHCNLTTARDLKNSGKYGSGISCRWALFMAWAFGVKLHLIFQKPV